MKTVTILILLMSLCAHADTKVYSGSDSNLACHLNSLHQKKGKRPQYRETNLRENDLNDIEVREIVSVAKNVVPEAIVSILSVSTSCPCEDGPRCTNQVWIVASDEGNSSSIVVSKIEGIWQIGPQQSWALELDKLEAERDSVQSQLATATISDVAGIRTARTRLNELRELELLLHELFPHCPDECD